MYENGQFDTKFFEKIEKETLQFLGEKNVKMEKINNSFKLKF